MFTIKKEVRRIWFLIGQYKDVTIYYVMNECGSVCASTESAEEAEAIRAYFDRDESEYRKMLAAAEAKEGIQEWTFVDENSEG